MLACRLFLADPESLESLGSEGFLEYEKEKFTETFLDTKSSSLSNAECILKCDSTAPNFWKLFCFAEDNIMEITTDEKDIREPLSRLTHFHCPDLITRDLLKPFFEIHNTLRVYLVGGCCVEVGKTNFGFAFCRISHFFNRNPHLAVLAIDDVAKRFSEFSLRSIGVGRNR